MPPNTEQSINTTPSANYKPSFPEIKYPTLRDHSIKSADIWLEGKRLDDNAEGLWRVHNKLYDLTPFLDRHPGGRQWLELSKGIDITEAFESHHITDTAEKILPKYYVRDAKGPRNSPYTFEENGFYRTLKRRIAPVLKTIPKEKLKRKSIYIIDSLVVSIFVLSILTVTWFNNSLFGYITAFSAGVSLALTVIAAHNFFHQKDNFRMYYFDLSCMSYKEWRISHVLSHHLFTNTIQDLEISAVEPFFHFLPHEKSFFSRYAPIITSFFVYWGMFFGQLVKRIIHLGKREINFEWSFLIPCSLPLTMFIVTGASLFDVIYWWIIIVASASFHFNLVGLAAAHHHPHIFHEGDKAREDRDWGLQELDAVMDRHDINGNLFLVLTNFGEHALHHLFPTLDHSILSELTDIVVDVGKEFNVQLRLKSQLKLFIGQFAQLIRIKPNNKPVYNFYKKTN